MFAQYLLLACVMYAVLSARNSLIKGRASKEIVSYISIISHAGRLPDFRKMAQSAAAVVNFIQTHFFDNSELNSLSLV